MPPATPMAPATLGAWARWALGPRGLRPMHWLLYVPFVFAISYLPRLTQVYPARGPARRTGALRAAYRLACLAVVACAAAQRHYALALLLACAFTYYFNPMSYAYPAGALRDRDRDR